VIASESWRRSPAERRPSGLLHLSGLPWLFPHVHPIDEAVAGPFATIDRAALADPWDRLIVATATTLDAPLVTRDVPIRQAGVVETSTYSEIPCGEVSSRSDDQATLTLREGR